jgi:type IV secretory pathway VirJ component
LGYNDPMIAGLLLAAATISSAVATSRGDQPFIVYPAAKAPGGPRKTVVLVVSGEGGWRSFDDQISGWLADAGYWVGGIDCMKYFSKPQDDREAFAADVRLYADALVSASGGGKDVRLVLAGYSFGADLAPWIAGAPKRDPRLAGLIMIGPDLKGSLEFRISEMLGFAQKDHIFETARALKESRPVPVLFIHGGKDDKSDAPALAAGFDGPKEVIVVPGATHHFSGQEEELKAALVGGLARLLAR